MTKKNDICFLYLHGYRSSPDSTKATFIKKYCDENFIDFYCPPLSLNPKIAIIEIQTILSNIYSLKKHIVVFGSSLGGFYAAWILENNFEEYNFYAVFLNPSTNPSKDLKDEVQDSKSWQEKATGVESFKQEYLDYLVSMEENLVNGNNFKENSLLVSAKGDKLLNWKDMVNFFPNCKHYIIEGSDHSITNFPMHWQFITDFIFNRG